VSHELRAFYLQIYQCMAVLELSDGTKKRMVHGSQLKANGYFCLMTIDNKVVENLAHLARLRFDDSEKESIRDGLEKMVAFVEKLQTVDTTGVAPLLHISDVTNVLREDVVQGSITREEALLNSPVKDEAFFKVPKVIKK
jgi:aspartyl-tRNA(Asn)/glutamyl-tRNA(Gln) amidotransferase subunit C